MSNEAVQPRVTLVAETEVAMRFVGFVGAAVSGHGTVDTVVDALADRFPAASAASIAIWYVVPHASPVKVNAVEVGDPTRALPRYAP